MLHFRDYVEFENSQTDIKIMNDAFTTLDNEYKSEQIGYYNLPHDSQDLCDELQGLMKKESLLHSGQITDIAVIGIGGSSLGIKAVDSILSSHQSGGKTLHFFENSDPINISATISKLKKESTLFIVISKSGTTIETVSIFKTILLHFDFDLQKSADTEHLIVITDKYSALSKFAQEYKIREFSIPENVGGRFSVLSAVGVVPLTLAGYDMKLLLAGAEEFLESFFAKKEQHLLQKACYLYEHHMMQSINVVFAYANNLENFCKWYVQLWGESLGKVDVEGKNVGLTPVGLIGSTDQHSFLQLLIEGPHDKTVTFIKIDDFENELKIPDISLKHIEKTDFVNKSSFNRLINAQCDATAKSLIQSDVAVDTIELDKISEENVGALIIYYELLTSLIGAMLHINTYNQPGVELGKTILYEKFGK